MEFYRWNGSNTCESNLSGVFFVNNGGYLDFSTFVEYNYSTNVEDGRDIDEEYKTASGE